MNYVHFSDNKYRFAHGKAPRGIGDWAFALDGNDSLDAIIWVIGVPFAEAKREAIRRAREAGSSRVEVLS